MVAQAARHLSRERPPLLRLLGFVAGSLASLLILFLLTAWIGSSIPRGERIETIERPVTIMLESNGIHTQLVLPIAHPTKDWRETFPSANEWVDGAQPSHVSIGFGEREVFMNTPTWRDLSPGTALRVVGFGGEGLIRVTPLVNPPQSRNRRAFAISQEQYAALVATVLADLPELKGQGFRSYERASYGPRDAYYESNRAYSVSTTCNQWTSDRLADAGIRTGWWTPLSGGVMKWAPPYSTDLSVD